MRTQPVRALRPRPVYCLLGHRLGTAVADEACRGRFTELGITLELGVEPDWIGGPFPPDEEWRIAFAKFYVGLDLAGAFRFTGREQYLSTWERLVTSWIEQVPLGSESTDTVARRALNWVYAWNEFASAPGFVGLPHGLDLLVADSLAAQIDWLRSNLTRARNHRTLELYALFICALALPELDSDGELLAFALAALDDNLNRDFRPDGVHVEASTHYHLIVLRSFLGVRVNAVRFGLALPDGFDERIERALEFALHCHRPDGEIPALSDADGGSYASLLALAGTQLGRSDLVYAATRGECGTPPLACNVSFPHGGYYIQRSGWGERERYEDERFLIFDCGPIGDGGHGHYDVLSVELAAGGRSLVLDPGRYTYHEGEPNLRHWFKGTAAHNTVCVDGLDQTAYRRGKPKGEVAQARFLGRIRRPGLDVVCGQVVTPIYDASHTRRVLFVAGEYWVFEDRLTAEQPHRYDLRWHLGPDAHGRVELNEQAGTVRAPAIALLFWPQVELSLEDGWYSPSYGVKNAAPVISAARESVVDATFISAAVPLASDGPLPELRVLDAGESTKLEVRRGTSVDTICWSADGREAAWRRLEATER
jgi:hypothetical protein